MNKQKNHKLGVIVPYRNRPEHLEVFKKHIKDYLNLKYDFELIIVEQERGREFNRGKLLNIGFIMAKEMGCDYVIFHDVDMLPIDADYTYSDIPLHMATNFEDGNRVMFDEYFGGVTLFPVETFQIINGFSNEYWGWGYEDDDLLYRCRKYGIALDEKKYTMMGGNTASIEFNGVNGYVRAKNNVKLDKFLTIFVSFYPDDVYCDHTKHSDTYSIFTIPGCDLSISYNSFKRYSFEVFDSNENVIVLDTEIKPNYKTNICVTMNILRKEIQLFQDGELIKTKFYTGDLYNYDDPNMFIGVGSPYYEENPKYFKGLFNSLAIYNKKLNVNEIREISNNQFFGLTQDFGEYKSAKFLTLYYDAKFIKEYKLIDLSGNNNHGEINNSNIVGYSFDDTKIIYVPYRRKSTFKLLSHEENGYDGGKWKNQSSRYNQARFHNEVVKGLKPPGENGLSNCSYTIKEKKVSNNEMHLVVSI